MRKIKIRFVVIIFLIAFICICPISINAYAENKTVYLGGYTVGFSIDKRGATIAGLTDVITQIGISSPAKDIGLIEGDTILEIDNKEINNALDIEKSIIDGKIKLITIKRENEVKVLKIKPILDCNGKYKLGVLIRENITGIGTITYFSDGKFASLGHPILDDNNNIMQIKGGNIYDCNIVGVVKGEKGNPGELKGITDNSKIIGNLILNSLNGAFGLVNNDNLYDNLTKINIDDGCVGKAKLRSNLINNIMTDYDIMIVKSDNSNKHYKNYVIKITDERLLNLTGGIVQGMSGSPIIQNNKLVGAVTHVFINDPTRGFGISINNMLYN